jgi:DNA-binding MurR/RpiR family transcriptional regulator
VQKDILVTIRERAPHEEGVNLVISEALIATPNSFVDVSVKSLATRLGVSEPSIIRYCRSLGCEGFKDFKKYLTQSIILEERYSREVSRPEAVGRENIDPRFADIIDSIFAALTAATVSTTFERIDEAAKVLSTCSKIAVLGLGGSSGVMATEAQNRFFRLGLNVTAHSDGYMQRMIAATLDKSSGLLVISSSGEPEPLKDSVKIARSAGAHCISICPAESSVAKLSTFNLPLELDTSIPYHQPNPIRYAQLLVLDCLADRIALMLGKPAQNSLRRISSALINIQPALPHQPVGD